MTYQKPLTDKDGEVRELNQKDFARGQSFSDLPASLQNKLRHRGQQKTPLKQAITIRLSPDVVEYFKLSGDGWQTRINDALKAYIKAK